MSKPKCLFNANKKQNTYKKLLKPANSKSINTFFKRSSNIFSKGDGFSQTAPYVCGIRSGCGVCGNYKSAGNGKTLTHDEPVPFRTQPIQRTLNTPSPKVIKIKNRNDLISDDKSNTHDTSNNDLEFNDINDMLTHVKSSEKTTKSRSKSIALDRDSKIIRQVKPRKATTMVSPRNVTKSHDSTEADITAQDIIDNAKWSDLLAHRSQHNGTDKRNVFDNCDPLRTLHFLTKELRAKIPAKAGVITNIINSIQEIMLRVPKEVSALNIDKSKKTHELWKPPAKKIEFDSKSVQTRAPYCFVRKDPVIKPTLNKGCQARICTDTNAVQTDFDRQYEDKFKYFENKLSELEKNVLKLREENNSLNKLVEKEQKLSQALRTEMYTNEKVYEDEKSKFLTENYNLSKENEQLKNKSYYYHKYESRIVIMQKQVESAQRKFLNSQLNFQKMCVLVSTRDKQLQDLQRELANINTTVKKQLTFKKTKTPPLSSTPLTLSATIEKEMDSSEHGKSSPNGTNSISPLGSCSISEIGSHEHSSGGKKIRSYNQSITVDKTQQQHSKNNKSLLDGIDNHLTFVELTEIPLSHDSSIA